MEVGLILQRNYRSKAAGSRPGPEVVGLVSSQCLGILLIPKHLLVYFAQVPWACDEAIQLSRSIAREVTSYMFDLIKVNFSEQIISLVF